MFDMFDVVIWGINTMKKIKTLVCVFSLCISFGYVHAQYEIKKHSINNGGGTLSGSNYELSGSVGQTDASTSQTNGQYALNGGYWQQNNDLIFKDNLE